MPGCECEICSKMDNKQQECSLKTWQPGPKPAMLENNGAALSNDPAYASKEDLGNLKTVLSSKIAELCYFASAV